jgi:cytochrome b involved in lipid metabolism
MTTDTVFSLSEVAKHNDETSLWVIIHGNVYDVSELLLMRSCFNRIE